MLTIHLQHCQYTSIDFSYSLAALVCHVQCIYQQTHTGGWMYGGQGAIVTVLCHYHHH